jgi:glycosyltransferase involved in cell wall biosynthesis
VSTPVGDLSALFSGAAPVGRLAADDPEDFAAQTLALLADPEARARYGVNARRLVDTELSWERVTAALEAFYVQVLGARV